MYITCIFLLAYYRGTSPIYETNLHSLLSVTCQVGQRRRESDKDPRADTELKQLIEEKGGLLVAQDVGI